jgi:hypothetical protein
LLSTGKELEKAILVCTSIPKSNKVKSSVKQKIYKEHLEELDFLAKTAGALIL